MPAIALCLLTAAFLAVLFAWHPLEVVGAAFMLIPMLAMVGEWGKLDR